MIQQGGRLACDVVENLLHAAGASQTRKGSRRETVAMGRGLRSEAFTPRTVSSGQP